MSVFSSSARMLSWPAALQFLSFLTAHARLISVLNGILQSTVIQCSAYGNSVCLFCIFPQLVFASVYPHVLQMLPLRVNYSVIL